MDEDSEMEVISPEMLEKPAFRVTITLTQPVENDNTLHTKFEFNPPASQIEGFDPDDPPNVFALAQMISDYIDFLEQLGAQVEVGRSAERGLTTKTKQ